MFWALPGLSMMTTSAHSHQSPLIMSRLSNGNFIRITPQPDHIAEGLEFFSSWQSFTELLQDSEQNIQGPEAQAPLSELSLPFMHLPLKSFGLGLTYPDHQDQVQIHDIVLFEKRAAPTRLNNFIPFRPYLDYEAEISLLLHRYEPEIFGYLIHNDLTDRMIQGLEYQKSNPAPSFLQAKSFPGSNAHSPIMIVGGAELWSNLNVSLSWNQNHVQWVDPKQNLMTPESIHKLVFQDPRTRHTDWVLIGTGTPYGTIFRSPTLAEVSCYFIKALFRPHKARALWVQSFDFLKEGDQLVFGSNAFGTYETFIVPSK